MVAGIRDLDDKIVMAAHGYARAYVVAEVDEFLDRGVEHVWHRTGRWVDTHAFRPQRYRRPGTDRADVDRIGNDFAAAIDIDLAGIAVDLRDGAQQAVIFTDEVGHERVVRLFIQLWWRCELLDMESQKDLMQNIS